MLRLTLPLLILPIISKAFTSDEFSAYMLCMSAAAWLAILLEYGFSISATKRVARSKGSLRKIGYIVSGVQSAKIILATACLIALLPVSIFIADPNWNIIWSIAAILLGILMAATPNYYFQGVERVEILGITELFASIFTIALTLIFVSNSSHTARLLAILIAVRLAATAFLHFAMRRQLSEAKKSKFSFIYGLIYLKSLASVFIFQAAVSLYTSFNVVYLGILIGVSHVGAYSTAEKVIRAGLGILGQISLVAFARLNNIKASTPQTLPRVRRTAIFFMVLVGGAGVILTVTFGPAIAFWLIHDQSGAEKLILIMSAVIPAITMSNVFAYQFILIEGLQKSMNIIIIAAGIMNIPAAYILTKKFGAEGMAISWIVIEYLVATALMVIVILNSKSRS